MPLMISSAFTLFVALGASKVPTFGLERRKPLASFPPAVNWVALLDKSPWLAFVVVLSVLLYKFGTAAIHIRSHLGMKYFSRYIVDYYIEIMTLTAFQAAHRPPDSDGSAIELNDLPPLPAPGSNIFSIVPFQIRARRPSSPTLLSHRCQVISAASKPSR
ncbi:hypothetical protein N7497_005728 [Penicillium chrysogenum]|nr:hypothetical protein N7497_005728 [Penicillium chrysogenum]